jgi:hypothetical protein
MPKIDSQKGFAPIAIVIFIVLLLGLLVALYLVQNRTNLIPKAFDAATLTPTANDSDGDGFANDIEAYMGTNPNKACADTQFGVPSNDHAYPADFNNDRLVDIVDFSLFRNHFGLWQWQTGYDKRYDLTGSASTDQNRISFADFQKYRSKFGITCDPLLPANLSFSAFQIAFGSTSGQPNYDADFDVTTNGSDNTPNGLIDIVDFSKLRSRFIRDEVDFENPYELGAFIDTFGKATTDQGFNSTYDVANIQSLTGSGGDNKIDQYDWEALNLDHRAGN